MVQTATETPIFKVFLSQKQLFKALDKGFGPSGRVIVPISRNEDRIHSGSFSAFDILMRIPDIANVGIRGNAHTI